MKRRYASDGEDTAVKTRYRTTQFSFIFGVVSDANGTFSAEDVGPLEAGVGTGCSDAGTLQRFGCFLF